MSIDERDRRALVRAAADSWGEEVATTLSELLPPTGSRPATQADVEGVLAALDAMDERFEGRFELMERRMELMGGRLELVEGRLQRVEGRLERVEGRVGRVEEGLAGLRGDVQALTERIDGIVHQVSADAERRFTDLVTSQTRSLMLSLFGTVVVIAALAFGLR